MAPMSQKRRRVEDDVRRPKKKKIQVKRQKHYHSDSDDDDEQPTVSDAPIKRAVEARTQPKGILKAAPPITAPEHGDGALRQDSDEDVDGEAEVDETELNTALNAAQAEEDSDLEDDDPDIDGDDAPPAQDAPSTEESDLDESDVSDSTSGNPNAIPLKHAKKRNDPSAFATSISRILGTKLTTTKRSDPVLARSATAAQANASLADTRLEAAARKQIKTEKRTALEKGRVRDVLGLDSTDIETGKVIEQEKRLRKVAQRGVVRLFNAVRAAQVRAETGEELVRGEGVVGVGQRKERVGEMSKEGFLELISKGGREGEAKA